MYALVLVGRQRAVEERDELMRVLHVHDHLEWCGGAETYVLRVIQELAQAGHEPFLAYAKGDPAVLPGAFHVPSLVSATRKGVRESYVAIKRLAEELKPDVVHFHNIYDIEAFEAAFQSAPTVVTAHGYGHICPEMSFFYRNSQRICQRTCGPACFGVTLKERCMTWRPKSTFAYYGRVRWFMKQAHRFAHVIGPSAPVSARFIAAGFPPDRVSTVPYFCPIEPTATIGRAPEEPTVLYIGRLREIKGVDFFIRALGLLAPQVKGVIVGDLNEQRLADYRRLAVSAGCADRLTFRPWVDRGEVGEVYRASSLLVFPSIWPETLGLVGLEAMANGVPVVAADVGGVQEWLLPDETGVLVPPKDAGALAEGMKRILESPTTRERYARRGMELVRTKFSVATHLRLLLQVYQSALAGNS